MLEHQFSMSSRLRRRDLITLRSSAGGSMARTTGWPGSYPSSTLSSKPLQGEIFDPRILTQTASMKHIHGP